MAPGEITAAEFRERRALAGEEFITVKSLSTLNTRTATIQADALYTILRKLEKIEERLAGPGIHVDPERRITRRRVFLDSHLHKPDHRQLPDRRE